jgi:hypothetical protein
MYSHLAGYLFWRVQITTRKNYDQKKRYSRLANRDGGGSYLAGTKYEHQLWYLRPEKITTGKKCTVVWPAIFFGGFNYNQKKLRPEKKGTVVWPMEAAQIWWELNTNSNNYGTILTTGKKILPEKKVQSSGRLFFSAGSNYNQKKLRPEKIKGTVVWPMEAAQIWWELNTNTNYGTYNRKKLLPGKKGTVVWPAIFFGGFKLQPEKNTTGKKKAQSSGQ